MMKTLITVILIFTGLLGSCHGPRTKDYSHLTEPRIIDKPDTAALIVEFDGDADVVIEEAFKALYKAFYSLKRLPKGARRTAPLARYYDFENILGEYTEENMRSVPWRGYVALPVPEGHTLDPALQNGEYPVKIALLKYGMVAEIVHFGPYKEETPTILKLTDYIELQGYRIIGLHEEEYIRGPGFLLSTPPKYITVIRYRVEPAGGR